MLYGSTLMVLKTIGYVLLGLIVLCIILMNFPVRIRLGYIGKKLVVEVRYLFLTLYPKKKKGSDEESDISDDGFDDTDDIFDDVTFADEKDSETSQTAGIASDSGSGAEELTEPGDEPEDEHTEPPDSVQTITVDESKDENGSGGKDEKDKKKRKDGKKKTGSEKPAKKKKKRHLADIIIDLQNDLTSKAELLTAVIDLVWNDLVKLIKKIYFTGLYLNIEIANEDCTKAAVMYGAVSGAVYNLIGFLQTTAKKCTVKTVDVDCIYDTPCDRSVYDGEITVRFRPQSVLNAIYFILFKFLFHLKKYRPIVNKLTGKKRR